MSDRSSFEDFEHVTDTYNTEILFQYFLLQDGRFDVLCCIKAKDGYGYPDYKEFLYTFFHKYFSSALLSTYVRPVVVRHCYS